MVGVLFCASSRMVLSARATSLACLFVQESGDQLESGVSDVAEIQQGKEERIAYHSWIHVNFGTLIWFACVHRVISDMTRSLTWVGEAAQGKR